MFWGLSELGGLGGWVRLIKHLLAAAPAFDKQKRPRSKSREVHQSNFRKLPINFEESGLDPKVNFSTWQNMSLLSKFQNSRYSFFVRNFDNPPKTSEEPAFLCYCALRSAIEYKEAMHIMYMSALWNIHRAADYMAGKAITTGGHCELCLLSLIWNKTPSTMDFLAV